MKKEKDEKLPPQLEKILGDWSKRLKKRFLRLENLDEAKLIVEEPVRFGVLLSLYSSSIIGRCGLSLHGILTSTGHDLFDVTNAIEVLKKRNLIYLPNDNTGKMLISSYGYNLLNRDIGLRPNIIKSIAKFIMKEEKTRREKGIKKLRKDADIFERMAYEHYSKDEENKQKGEKVL
jgi:hypothetical protein